MAFHRNVIRDINHNTADAGLLATKIGLIKLLDLLSGEFYIILVNKMPERNLGFLSDIDCTKIVGCCISAKNQAHAKCVTWQPRLTSALKVTRILRNATNIYIMNIQINPPLLNPLRKIDIYTFIQCPTLKSRFKEH